MSRSEELIAAELIAELTAELAARQKQYSFVQSLWQDCEGGTDK